ncbi:MAG: right-handed parallel beta-helix repeat-containing protein [Bacteroidales bacterium]|nr:MAG: right-handed parallel beta-helix repeat-containing protein [Bacteroidales bacterium]
MKSTNYGESSHSIKNLQGLRIQFLKWNELFSIVIILLFIVFGSLAATAQPSGGPYGPIQQTYELPEVSGRIYYVAPDGKAGEQGESPARPVSLEAAIERVKTGDAIVMRGGTYRTGNLVLNQGITIQPYADEQPVLKGTYVATDWKSQRNGLWTTSWDHLFPSRPAKWWRRHRHGKETPLCRFNNDMVFVDGKFLQAVGWEGEVDENTYYIDYESGLVYIGVDPADKLVEITAFDAAIIRTTEECHNKTSDKQGPVIRGITFTQYAYRALEVEGTTPEGLSDEADHGKEVVGTTLEHCTISFCSRVAAFLKGDKLTIRHCKISDTSTEGIYIIASCDVLLEKNIFTRNNIERITGYYPAAVKIFNQSYRVTCRDNLVIDHEYSNGIWYDVGNVDGIFINNWVEAVGSTGRKFTEKRQWPSESGFFFEISKGVICTGNVFVNCDQGIFVLNSSDAQIYQNTLINSIASIGRTPRTAEGDHFGWHPSTGPGVDERDGHIFVNNLLTGDENFRRPLLFIWQTSSLCERLDKPMMKKLDYNVYVRDTNKNSRPLIYWSPAKNENCQLSFESPGDLNKQYPEFSAGSKYFANYDGPLFRSHELGNYHLLEEFSGSKAATSLPDKIRKLLGYPKKGSRFVGAYPPCQ